MQRLRARLVAALSVVCVVGLTEVVRADERTDARREFRAGMQAIGDGRYDEGVEHLERAYDILPHPNVLYNIGLAHMYAGRSELAIEYFERYRETAPASDAIEVDSLIASLRQVKPAETQSVAVAEGDGSNLQSGADLSYGDTLAALEHAAQEVRRLSDEQASDVLRKQADELDRAVQKLRERQASAQSAQAVAQSTPKTETKLPENQTTQQTPPMSLPNQGNARSGVYEEQVVSASRFSQSPLDAPNATAIITAQDIRMSGQTSLSNLLRRIAGVEVNTMSPSHSEVSIRGLNRRAGTKVLLLWDGRPIRKDFFGSNWIDSLPVSLEEVERVEIIRGPASALYGADAFSGIINIITRAPGQGKNYAVGRYGSQNSAGGVASFVGRDGKFAWRYSTSFQQQDSAKLIVQPGRVDVLPATDTPNRAQLGAQVNGEVNYAIAEKALVTVGGSFNGGDTVTQGLSRIAQIVTDNSWQATTWASVTTPVGIRLGAWYDHIGADPGGSYVVPGAVARSGHGLVTNQAEVDLSWNDSFDLLVPQTFTLGATYRYKQITWPWIDGEQTQHHVGGYLQDVLQLAKPLRLQVGARLDRHPLLPNLQFSPRGSLVYRFLGEQSIRLSAGRAFRSPSQLESYLMIPNETPVRGVTAWGLGNEKLDPESITSFEVGYQNQQSDYFALEANVYYNQVKDAIFLTNVDRYTVRDFADPNNGLAKYVPDVSAFPVSQLSFANERATYRQLGGELGLRFFPVKGLDFYTNYSIHDTAPTDKKKVDAVRANEQQTSLHKVNGGIQYRAPFGMELSADLSWLSRQIWVEQVTDTERGVRWQTYTVDPLVYLSARIGWRLLQDRLELGVTGNNLLFQDKRQHPFAQPLDTRVLGSAKVWF